MNEKPSEGYLEECHEDVWGGAGRQDEGQEGAEASIENGGPDVPQGLDSPLVSISTLLQEVVDDVCAVVHAEANGNDEVDAGDGVDGEAPEVDEAANIDESDEDTGQHQHTGGQVLNQNQSGEEDAEKRDADVPPEFQLNDLVCLPTGVLSAHREGSIGEVGLGHYLLDLIHCWDPLWRSME